MSSESIEKFRGQAQEILTRLSTDAEFRAQVEKDPEGTLVAAGLPADAVPAILTEAQIDAEVSGYCIIDSCTGVSSVVVVTK